MKSESPLKSWVFIGQKFHAEARVASTCTWRALLSHADCCVWDGCVGRYESVSPCVASICVQRGLWRACVGVRETSQQVLYGGNQLLLLFFFQLMSTKWIYTIWHKREERQSVKKQNPFWVLKFRLLRLQAFCILFSVIFFVLFAFLGRDSPPVYFFFFFFNFQ